MPATTRGKPRDVLTAVSLGFTMYYAWFTRSLEEGSGVGQSDLNALGHLSGAAFPSGADVKILYSPQSPKAARFRKVINRAPEAGKIGVMTLYGDGSTNSAIGKAAQAGWKCSEPLKRPGLTSNARSKVYGATLSNGIIYLNTCSPAQLTSYASLLGLDTNISATELNLAVRGAERPHPFVVKLETSGGAITMNCASNKISEAQDAGWSIVQPERL